MPVASAVPRKTTAQPASSGQVIFSSRKRLPQAMAKIGMS
jgi:hypothetical protein